MDMTPEEILEKIMSEINDIIPASEAALAEEIEPVIKKYLEYGELKPRKIEEALRELVHLHSCEQEGLRPPTPEMWFNAVNKAAEALGETPEPPESDAVAWVNVYDDGKDRFISDTDYGSYGEAYENRDKLKTYLYTAKLFKQTVK